MQNETRVNLRHLLEDMRDSYSAPLEEVIITELIANTLDSRATRLQFIVSPEGRFLRCADNGAGMRRPQIKEYHNIASSEKVRGAGIGFAGVGAKLSLLLAERVVTESKGGRGSRAATEWRLVNPYRAPWKFVPTTDAVQTPRGTSVTVYFPDNQSHLLRKEFVANAIVKHFYPLLHEYLKEEILRFVYRRGVEIVVNGELLVLPDAEQRFDRGFKVFLGKSRKPVGAGFLTKRVLEQGWLARLAGRIPSERQMASGLSVSTYGKVIKTGWEWVGVLPKSAEQLCGVVEIPALSEVLTANKNDFLTDSVHLRKFYRLRKAVQQAILPALRSLGEYTDAEKKSAAKDMRQLERQIEAALGFLSPEFPELDSLLGGRRTGGNGSGAPSRKDRKEPAAAAVQKEAAPPQKQKSAPDAAFGGAKLKEKEEAGGSARRRPGLSLALEDFSDAPEILGRIIGDTVSINTLHPAWKKTLETGQEEYHILVVVGLTLAEFVAPEKHPIDFLARFLSSWSMGGAEQAEKAQPALL